MSVHEGLSQPEESGSRNGRILVFLPLLIAILGAAAIVLGQLSDQSASQVSSSGYGIDERVTGAIADANPRAPEVALGR